MVPGVLEIFCKAGEEQARKLFNHLDYRVRNVLQLTLSELKLDRQDFLASALGLARIDESSLNAPGSCKRGHARN